MGSMVESTKRWAGRLEASHGSCGLGALSEPGAETMDDAYYYPWLMQYLGLEYDAMGDYFSESWKNEGYKQPRSSNSADPLRPGRAYPDQ